MTPERPPQSRQPGLGGEAGVAPVGAHRGCLCPLEREQWFLLFLL